MKYYLLLAVALLSLRMTGQPWLNETSQWKQYYRFSTYPPGLAIEEDVWIRLDGDTLIGSTTYYRVLKTGTQINYLIQSGDTTYQGPIHEYLDPIREEGQYFFAFDQQAGQEYLLYDFGAQVGDTLESGKCQRDTVIRIDTVYLGDAPRKRFHLPTGAHGEICTLIEGIGSTFGFYWQPCNVVPDPQIYLQCYSQDGHVISFDSNYDCSSLILADDVIQTQPLAIYPNPFTDEIEIEMPATWSQPVSISVVNQMGVVVYENHLQYAKAKEQISIPDLPPGIYFVCIRHPRECSAFKMIKL